MIPEERRRGVRTGDVEVRQLAGRRGRIPVFGKTTELVQCPYCREESRVHVRSFAAVGKVCGGCGALLTEGPCYLAVEDVKRAERAVSSIEWRRDDPPVDEDLIGWVFNKGESWVAPNVTFTKLLWDGSEWLQGDDRLLLDDEVVIAWAEEPGLPPWAAEYLE